MVGAPSYQEIGAESPTLMGAPKFDDTGVTGHGLPPDSNSGGASVQGYYLPPGDSVLEQKLLPQDESSSCIGTLALGRFLRRKACTRIGLPM